jgi:DNA topoisomerase 2-associated protein PAT1
MNDDTFGAGADSGAGQGPVGRDFDFFGNTAQVSNAIGEEQVRYHLQHPHAQPDNNASRPSKPKRTGYEKYEDPGYIPDIQAKSSAWSSKTQAGPGQSIGDSRISTAAPARKMMSLEEVEAQMRAQSQPQHPPFFQHDPYAYQQQQQLPPMPPQQAPHSGPQYPPMQPPQKQPQQPPQQMPPAAPVQQRVPTQPVQVRGPQQPLQILQNPNRPRHSPQPSIDRAPMGPGGQPVITNPQQLMELSEEQRKIYLEEDAKRAKRNHKIFLLSKGNGLMTPQDKNFITRIQLQQLVSATSNTNDGSPEAALAEDFYYQVYSQIRGAPRQHPTQPLGHFAQTYLFQTGNRTGNNRRAQVNGDNHMQRMQQQVQRAVEAAKLKPKNKQLIIEGSLGKISFSNAKTPKPLLNIKRQENTDSRPTSKGQVSKSDRKSSLRNIEAVYTDLMNLEDLERKMPPPAQEGDADAVQASIEWRETFKAMIARLWQDLKVLDPIVPGALETHPFIAMLSFPKCKKIIPRVFRLIDQEQRVTILTMIVVHLDQLDVVRNGKVPPGESQPPAAVREDIEVFNQQVLPCLLGYISDAPINIVIGLLGLILDHTNVSDVVQTKIGLAMLTILLSRAELVRETGTVSEQDSQQWSTLYNRFFDTLEALLAYIFPGPVNSGDDMYVWQFLAAVGIGANPEQQQRLVIGVKDRVMATVQQSKALPAEISNSRLANVNLFMRAIGLDVEMLG